VIGIDVVGFGPQFGPPHVLDPHDGAVPIGVDRHVGKLLRSLQQVLHDDRSVQTLPFQGGRSAKLSGGNLDVIDPQRLDHVFERQAVAGELDGVQPHAHRVLRAERGHLAHAGNPGQDFFQVRLGVVAQIIPVHAAVFGDEPHDDQVIPRRFADLHAGALDHLRQAGHGQLQLVLHLGPGQIRVGPRLEGQLDAGRARGIAGPREIQHVVEARHLLLDDLRHAVLHRLGRGTGVETLDRNRRGRDRGILRDGQDVNRESAQHHHDDGDDPGEDRPVEKESG